MLLQNCLPPPAGFFMKNSPNVKEINKKDSFSVDNIVQLAKELISVESTVNKPVKRKKTLQIANDHLKEFTVESFHSHGVSSLLIHNQKSGTKKFKIILNAHLDVVAGKPKQFRPFIKDGKLFGRGSYDMKTAAAVMIFLFKEIATKVPYPLALQLTTDEENGGYNGVKYQIDKGIRADFVITGECGTNFEIVYQSKGMLRVKIIAQGKASHSAYLWRGENAILKLHKAIYAILQKYPLPKAEVYQTTVNVAHILTKNLPTDSLVPDHCEAILDIRFVPEDEHSIVNTIKSVLPKGVTYKTIFHFSPPQTNPENEYIKLLQKTVSDRLNKEAQLARAHGSSDMRHFMGVGCDGVEFGPVGHFQHHDREYVDIKSLENYYQILKDFLLSVK